MDRLHRKNRRVSETVIFTETKNSDRQHGVSGEIEVHSIKKSIMNWNTKKYPQITKHELTLGHSINLKNKVIATTFNYIGKNELWLEG